ncbi:Hypothetical predicted protein [Paramuricea clavata]|uniref:Uncharacterized protein n=1 Tax=Paramuricea clavata TaxID=317549 RepID=A0A6S7J419_PARCT|nr:Hypothetical predicted protein [Paramuricea clavata]
METAKLIVAFGTCMDAVIYVKNGKIWTSVRKSTKKWVESDDYRKWRENHDSGEVECDRAMKLDCIGHVQKRMDTHLRDLRKREKKLKDGKSVKGSKQLTS